MTGTRRDKSPGGLDDFDSRGAPLVSVLLALKKFGPSFTGGSTMMNRITLGVAAAALLASAPAWTPSPSFAAPKKEFTMAWTVYVGWMPWPYAADAGIVKKWADKYHIKINVIQINDYVESLNQFTAGKIDAVTAANMDALTVPAAGGVDTSLARSSSAISPTETTASSSRKAMASPVSRAKRSISSSFPSLTICWPVR